MIGFLLNIYKLLLCAYGYHHQRLTYLLLSILTNLIAVVVPELSPSELFVTFAASDLDRLARVLKVQVVLFHSIKTFLTIVAFSAQWAVFFYMLFQLREIHPIMSIFHRSWSKWIITGCLVHMNSPIVRCPIWMHYATRVRLRKRV